MKIDCERKIIKLMNAMYTYGVSRGFVIFHFISLNTRASKKFNFIVFITVVLTSRAHLLNEYVINTLSQIFFY